MWDALLPDDVQRAWCNPRDAAPDLLPEEAALVASAVPSRRREFAHGRGLARHLLRQLGIENFALLAGSRREPLWPAGIVGSVTHTEQFCGVAVGRATDYVGIGIDVEPDAPIDPQLAARICRPDELMRLAGAGNLDPAIAARLVFSCKEAVYKCQFPALGRALGFADVAIRLAPEGTFTVELTSEGPVHSWSGALAGRWARRGGLLLTAAWLPR